MTIIKVYKKKKKKNSFKKEKKIHSKF